MIGGESTQQLMDQPRIAGDIERRRKIQDQIASYRQLKYEREQERLLEEADMLEQQRRRIQDQNAQRRAYMQVQKKKLDEYKQAMNTQMQEFAELNKDK